MLDLRIPIGIYFLLNSAILIGTGCCKPSECLMFTSKVNLDVVWGIVMAVFGALMLSLYFMEKNKSKAE
jgi:hypothetical protein